MFFLLVLLLSCDVDFALRVLPAHIQSIIDSIESVVPLEAVTATAARRTILYLLFFSLCFFHFQRFKLVFLLLFSFLIAAFVLFESKEAWCERKAISGFCWRFSYKLYVRPDIVSTFRWTGNPVLPHTTWATRKKEKKTPAILFVRTLSVPTRVGSRSSTGRSVRDFVTDTSEHH